VCCGQCIRFAGATEYLRKWSPFGGPWNWVVEAQSRQDL
jgi:apolipoprotein N-acyltransferase